MTLEKRNVDSDIVILTFKKKTFQTFWTLKLAADSGKNKNKIKGLKVFRGERFHS